MAALRRAGTVLHLVPHRDLPDHRSQQWDRDVSGNRRPGKVMSFGMNAEGFRQPLRITRVFAMTCRRPRSRPMTEA